MTLAYFTLCLRSVDLAQKSFKAATRFQSSVSSQYGPKEPPKSPVATTYNIISVNFFHHLSP